MDIQSRLFSCQDSGYRDFQAKLLPTLDRETIIGVRTPELRALVREIAAAGEGEAFLAALPHRHFEENQLHALLISQMRDFSEVLTAVEAFLPLVDNWATCDQLRPKAFGKHRDLLLPSIKTWLSSEHPYTIRFAIEMLMVHYLEKDFREDYPLWVSRIRSGECYVNMMIAWYFATALAMQYESVLPYLTQRRLDPWVHNKTIQKAKESYRIPEEQKAYLTQLRLRPVK